MKSKKFFEEESEEEVVFDSKETPKEITGEIYEEDNYKLTERPFDADGRVLYTVYDPYNDFVGSFIGRALTEKEKEDIKKSFVYEKFLDTIESDWDWMSKYYSDNYMPYDTYKSYYKEPSPEEIEAQKKKERELIESLCKSDTIVFHKEDPTTTMLDQIYKGKGWDVYTGTAYSGELSREGIQELIQRHDRVVGLGHGSPSGLIGGTLSKEEVPFLKDKKIFALWCYAATFFKNNGFTGHGILCSDNAPSEDYECKYACNADVSKEWILENITYWSKCLADVVDLSWTNPEEACRIAKENYYKSYADCKTDDERKVVEFNTNTIQVV